MLYAAGRPPHMQPISLQHLEVYDVGEDGYPRAFCCVVSNLFKQHTALYTLQADSRESKVKDQHILPFLGEQNLSTVVTV